VSISVALILFEGSLSLRLSERRAIGGVVRNLIGRGAVVTWAISAAAAHFIFF
jgi:CPA1 family monovalent cation:H+ antiporter